MALAALREEFQDVFQPPPVPDWATALKFVETLKDLERTTGEFDSALREWRAKTSANLTTGLAFIESKTAGLPADKVREFLLPMVDEALIAIDHLTVAYSQPFHENPKSAEAVRKLGSFSGPAGRYIRKQLRRLEDLRVTQHNFAVDMYYTLLAFRTEVEGREGTEVFTDGSAFGEFLRKQIA